MPKTVRLVASPFAGTVTWSIVLLGRLWSIDDSWWIARDDAVITLSHAKNAARFGTIGVSPGGDRVEGFSSPLHFLAAYVVQVPATISYRTVSIVLLVAAVAVTGGVATAALRSLSVRLGTSRLRSDLIAVGLSTVVAVAVAASWTSIGWIGSGMENPLVVLTGLAVAASSLVLPGTRAAQVMTIVSVTAFSVARVEFAALTLPLIVTVAWLHASRLPPTPRRTVLAQTIAIPLVAIACVHVGRRLYFGEWLPNTAIAQSRESGADEILFIALSSLALLALLAATVVGDGPLVGAARSLTSAIVAGVLTLSAGALVWMVVTGRTAGSPIELALLPPLIPLAVLVLVLLHAVRAFERRPCLVDNVFVALVAVPLCQYLVTGPARLDPYRVAVVVVPFLALWAAVLALRLAAAMRSAAWPTPHLRRYATAATLSTFGLMALVILGWTAFKDDARPLNYEITGAPLVVDIVRDTRDAQLGGDGLVIVANPDLGKVSFDKSAIMVDLGLLGDPLLTRITRDRHDLVDDYLQTVAAPDVVEAHSGWACEYADWLDSDAFGDTYEPSDERWLEGRPQAPGCPMDGRWTIWVRVDATGEYALTRDLLTAERPAERVMTAITDCAGGTGDVFRCQGVRRSVQRAAAVLRADGAMTSVVDAMRASPSADLDVELLLRGPGWADDAFDEYVRLVESAV